MTARRRVVITDCDHGTVDRELAILTPRFDVHVADCRTEDDVLAATRNADAVICQYAPVTDRVLAELSTCDIVVRYGVGVDNIDTAAAARHGIPVANVPDYGVEEVADHALALTLTLLRGIGLANHHVRAGGWDYRVVAPLHRIAGLTIGVLGHGRIGEAYAQRVRTLGPDVIVSDIRPLDGVPQVPLDELLARAHLVSLHVPADGRPLFGAREFAAMRDGAFLVNTARGTLVDHDALLAALDSGRLAGAALDVLDHEPPASTALTGHERIIVTPHSAWYSEESFRRLKDGVAHEVVRVLSGTPPRNPVNALAVPHA